VNLLWAHLRTSVTQDRLCAADLLCCFISRRVLPLHARCHKMCHMSGRFDPTRTSKLELSAAAVAKLVNWISQAKMTADWKWGMEPFYRDDLPPQVSSKTLSAPASWLLLTTCALIEFFVVFRFAEVCAAGGRGRGPISADLDA
jgi:hypothetical protein